MNIILLGPWKSLVEYLFYQKTMVAVHVFIILFDKLIDWLILITC